jgi:hypothetical protein
MIFSRIVTQAIDRMNSQNPGRIQLIGAGIGIRLDFAVVFSLESTG